MRKRVIEALTAMLEQQVAVREATTALLPQIEKGSRQALASIVGLGKTENAIAEACGEILSLVEEVEFGITLPSALRVVRREMTAVEGMLTRGRADEGVVAAEQEIEKDLQASWKRCNRCPRIPIRPSAGNAANATASVN